MATKRKPIHATPLASRMKFMSNSENKGEAKGTKPVPEQSSIGHVLLMMVLHICRRIVFVDTFKRVAVYAGSLFLVSLLGDVLPIPRGYFSRSDNMFNQFFVKWAWGWTMIITFPFLVFTSYTTCCGKREKVLKHFIRLCIATASWYFWVNSFLYVERSYGKCSVKGDFAKRDCLEKGHFWHSFDISGHSFILVYCSLVLIEEARAIVGWERIKDLIREEYHTRSNVEDSKSVLSTSPLGGLSEEEFIVLKTCYGKFTPTVRALFILMTFFSMLWDFMLFFTMLYFHNMVEKLLGGSIAIFMWFVTYSWWYKIPKVIPDMPGDGLFRYKEKQGSEVLMRKRKSIATPTPSRGQGQLPKFMGMPLYGLRSQDNERSENNSNGNNALFE